MSFGSIGFGGPYGPFHGMPMYSNYAAELGNKLWEQNSKVTEEEIEKIKREALQGTILTEDELQETIQIRIENLKIFNRKYSEYPSKNEANDIVEKMILEDFKAWTLEQAEEKGSAKDRMTSIFTPEEIEEIYRKELRERIQSLDDQDRRAQLQAENADLWVTPKTLEEFAPVFVQKRLEGRG